MKFIEIVARAIDPLAFYWLDSVETDHPAYLITLNYVLKKAERAVQAVEQHQNLKNDVQYAALSQLGFKV